MELYIVRHGESQANMERRYSGWTETPLSSEGLRQAEKAGFFLADFKPDMLYCSDLQRARDTAGAIGQVCSLQPIETPLLREIHFGQWEGKTFNEIDTEYPSEVKKWLEDPITNAPPGGETVADVNNRMLSFIESMKLENKSAARIVAVSHGGSIRALLHSVFNYDSNSFWEIRIANTSINLFLLENDGLKSSYYNFTGHLNEPSIGGVSGDH